MTDTRNLGYWMRRVNTISFLIKCGGEVYNGYLREIRRGRWLVFDIPLPCREAWTLLQDRHNLTATIEEA